MRIFIKIPTRNLMPLILWHNALDSFFLHKSFCRISESRTGGHKNMERGTALFVVSEANRSNGQFRTNMEGCLIKNENWSRLIFHYNQRNIQAYWLYLSLQSKDNKIYSQWLQVICYINWYFQELNQERKYIGPNLWGSFHMQSKLLRLGCRHPMRMLGFGKILNFKIKWYGYGCWPWD